jgi:hypothetical protein
MKDKKQKRSGLFEHLCAVFRNKRGMETRTLVFAIGGIALTMTAAMLMTSFGGVSDIIDKQVNRTDTMSQTYLPVGDCAKLCIAGIPSDPNTYSGGACMKTLSGTVPETYKASTFAVCESGQTCYCIK